MNFRDKIKSLFEAKAKGTPQASSKIDPEDVQYPVNLRARRRQAIRNDVRQQRKGQRAYQRSQRATEFRRDTLLAQQYVLETFPADHPVRRNVENAVHSKQAHAARIAASVSR